MWSGQKAADISSTKPVIALHSCKRRSSAVGVGALDLRRHFPQKVIGDDSIEEQGDLLDELRLLLLTRGLIDHVSRGGSEVQAAQSESCGSSFVASSNAISARRLPSIFWMYLLPRRSGMREVWTTEEERRAHLRSVRAHANTSRSSA